MHTTDISFPPELIAKIVRCVEDAIEMTSVQTSASMISRRETAFLPVYGIF